MKSTVGDASCLGGKAHRDSVVDDALPRTDRHSFFQSVSDAMSRPMRYRPFRAVLGNYGLNAECLQCGAIFCKTSIVNCLPTDQIIAAPKLYSKCRDEIQFGDYRVGRYGFLLGRVVLYEAPIFVNGALGLWNWNEIRRNSESVQGRKSRAGVLPR